MKENKTTKMDNSSHINGLSMVPYSNKSMEEQQDLICMLLLILNSTVVGGRLRLHNINFDDHMDCTILSCYVSSPNMVYSMYLWFDSQPRRRL